MNGTNAISEPASAFFIATSAAAARPDSITEEKLAVLKENMMNFMFRHNKKVYRVPEVLFFYRVKDKSESRNAQGDAKYHQLRKYMKKKYPEMRRYIVIKWLKKIAHMIVKIDGKTVKIFRIPAWTRK